MNIRESEKTLVTLANLTELARVIIQGVVGSPLTGDVINQIVLARTQACLKTYL
jgi:hypothetical protein